MSSSRHTKAQRQRILCLGGVTDSGVCTDPFLMVSDVGLTFGTASLANTNGVSGANLKRWRDTAVWKDGEFKPRLLMPLSLSYDHRVIDGADAARFVRRLAELLENPMVMLLHA